MCGVCGCGCVRENKIGSAGVFVSVYVFFCFFCVLWCFNSFRLCAVCRLADQLVGLLVVGYQFGCLTDWMVLWLASCLFECQFGWLIAWMNGSLIDWLSEWLTDLADWLTDWLAVSSWLRGWLVGSLLVCLSVWLFGVWLIIRSLACLACVFSLLSFVVFVVVCYCISFVFLTGR